MAKAAWRPSSRNPGRMVSGFPWDGAWPGLCGDGAGGAQLVGLGLSWDVAAVRGQGWMRFGGQCRWCGFWGCSADCRDDVASSRVQALQPGLGPAAPRRLCRDGCRSAASSFQKVSPSRPPLPGTLRSAGPVAAELLQAPLSTVLGAFQQKRLLQMLPGFNRK